MNGYTETTLREEFGSNWRASCTLPGEAPQTHHILGYYRGFKNGYHWFANY